MHWRRPTQSRTASFPTVCYIMQPKQTWCRHQGSWRSDQALQEMEYAQPDAVAVFSTHCRRLERAQGSSCFPMATREAQPTAVQNWFQEPPTHDPAPARALLDSLGLVRLGQVLTAPEHVSWESVSAKVMTVGLGRGWRPAASLVRSPSGLEAPGQELLSVPSWDRRKDVSPPSSFTGGC